VNAALRSSAAHLIVESLENPELAEQDEHHLMRVLRIRTGEIVSLTDGAGRWRLGRLQGRTLVPTGEIETSPQLPPVRIATAIPKGGRLDWMVQKVTELGCTHLALVHCERSVVRWAPERVEAPLARLRRIARDAVTQSRRTAVPTIDPPRPFGEVVGWPGAVVADPGGRPLAERPSWIVIGPEGGLVPDEFARAGATACLSANVLRIETAAMAATCLLAHDGG